MDGLSATGAAVALETHVATIHMPSD